MPAAQGFPAPAYATVGALPAGLAFDVITRVLSGAPTAVGSGTIRIRATNSEGTADWTVAYTTNPANAAPSFVVDTGNPQTWMQNQSITPLTVPAAQGFPAPAYATVGALPAGLAFDVITRVLSGAPTAVGSGTIRIRATNSEGTADWTVAYTTNPANAAPSFVVDTGNPQTWMQNQSITPLTVPAAVGIPAPPTRRSGPSLPGRLRRDNPRPGRRPDRGRLGHHQIRATNSEGTADWTVAYTINAYAKSGTD